jgi:hypothetical protein
MGSIGVGVPPGRWCRSYRRRFGGNSRIEQRIIRGRVSWRVSILRLFIGMRPTNTTLRTFRAHSWIVRMAAVAVAVIILVPTLTGSNYHSASGTSTGVVIFLIGLGLLIPVGLLLWDSRRGVHVYEDGIRSVGAYGSRFLPWTDIAAFETESYAAGMIAVFAKRSDGTRVALGDTARWPYQRRAVEQTRDQLTSYREQWAGPQEHGPATDV